MRAMVLEQHGAPEVLHAAELPTPVPGRHELLVEVHATSVNPVDTKIRAGVGAARRLPIVLGYDASGVVRACGSDVQGWREGDLVFGCPNRSVLERTRNTRCWTRARPLRSRLPPTTRPRRSCRWSA
ncbi:MAG: alcohol dehydrogenase catalytic domain-containing protein [Polyangia bacterium]